MFFALSPSNHGKAAGAAKGGKLNKTLWAASQSVCNLCRKFFANRPGAIFHSAYVLRAYAGAAREFRRADSKPFTHFPQVLRRAAFRFQFFEPVRAECVGIVIGAVFGSQRNSYSFKSGAQILCPRRFSPVLATASAFLILPVSAWPLGTPC